MFELMDSCSQSPAVIRVVGVGGGDPLDHLGGISHFGIQLPR